MKCGKTDIELFLLLDGQLLIKCYSLDFKKFGISEFLCIIINKKDKILN